MKAAAPKSRQLFFQAFLKWISDAGMSNQIASDLIDINSIFINGKNKSLCKHLAYKGFC